MSETLIVSQCLEWLAMYRIRSHRNNTGAGWLVPHGVKGKPKTTEEARWIEFGHVGSGDITGLISPWGIHLEVECKTLTGTKRKMQILRHKLINDDGGIHIYARSVEELETNLKKHPRLAGLPLSF